MRAAVLSGNLEATEATRRLPRSMQTRSLKVVVTSTLQRKGDLSGWIPFHLTHPTPFVSLSLWVSVPHGARPHILVSRSKKGFWCLFQKVPLPSAVMPSLGLLWAMIKTPATWLIRSARFPGASHRHTSKGKDIFSFSFIPRPPTTHSLLCVPALFSLSLPLEDHRVLVKVLGSAMMTLLDKMKNETQLQTKQSVYF